MQVQNRSLGFGFYVLNLSLLIRR